MTPSFFLYRESLLYYVSSACGLYSNNRLMSRGGVLDGIRTCKCLKACRRAYHSDMPHPTYLITLQPTEIRRTLLSYAAPY
jgi:hypothetical protein